MKNQFLVFINPKNPSEGLRIAELAEWRAIMQSNVGIECDKKRYFIKDCICENGLDVIYIETTKSEYDKWHKQAVLDSRKWKYGKNYETISGDVLIDGYTVVFDMIPDSTDIEQTIISEMVYEELKKALTKWRWWASDFLEFYENGEQKNAVKLFSERYGISLQHAREKKRAFEKFILEFYRQHE